MRPQLIIAKQTLDIIINASHNLSKLAETTLNDQDAPMILLTLREVAETIKVSESTVRRWVQAGELTAYKLGKRGQLRVRQEELESFLERQRFQSNAADDEEATSDGSAI